jgi:hypothetical protein
MTTATTGGPLGFLPRVFPERPERPTDPADLETVRRAVPALARLFAAARWNGQSARAEHLRQALGHLEEADRGAAS